MRNKTTKVWVKRYPNSEVTDYYLDTIKNAFILQHYEVVDFRNWNELKYQLGNIVVISDIIDAAYAIFHKYKYMIWLQGIMPEESYLRNHSHIRETVLELLEKNAIKHSRFCFMVSKAMKKHYESKYNVNFGNRYYIMPCGNEEFHDESFCAPSRYENNVFCYMGSINAWQCVDESIRLYKEVEENHEGTKLLLLVKDRSKAEEMAHKYHVKNYEIDYVPLEKLQQRVSSVKYGFILRADIELNRIATPTKLSTYLANGIIPVFSDCLDGINEITESTKYKIKLKNEYDTSGIEDFMNMKIDPSDIHAEYHRVYFSNYYDKAHTEDIIQLIKNL
jgi:hypothetical protein